MRLTICQGAATHDDGTFSITRGGLEHFSIDEKLEFVLFIEATTDEVPAGKQHAFTLSCVGCGADSEFGGYVGVPGPEVTVFRAMMKVELKPTTPGSIAITFKVGEHEAKASIRIRPSTLS